MAIRTEECKVREIIDTDPDLDILPFITYANTMTDKIATRATDMAITVTAAELLLIETYIAAHFYALKDPQYIEKQTGKARAVFQGQTGMALNSTFWGQMALAMDPTGVLGGNQAYGAWLGTPIT